MRDSQRTPAVSRDRVVHLVDDDDVLRASLWDLLKTNGFNPIGYRSALDFLAELETAPSGCVITDVKMPEVSGIELLRRLSDRLADFPVIVLTGEANVAMAVDALKDGAVDFIQKPIQLQTLLAAVGNAWRQLDEHRARAGRRLETANRLAALSGREREVLRGVVAGQGNKEIARVLGISPRTVEVYRANLMIKTGSESLSDLVRLALDEAGPSSVV